MRLRVIISEQGDITVPLSRHEGKNRALRLVASSWAAHVGGSVEEGRSRLALKLAHLPHAVYIAEAIAPTLSDIVNARPLSPEEMRARHEAIRAQIAPRYVMFMRSLMWLRGRSLFDLDDSA